MQSQFKWVFKRISLAAVFIFQSSLMSFELPSKQIDQFVSKHYQTQLESLFKYFHQNPELSLIEHKTAKRMAKELSALGYTVTEGVGGTGVVAIMENGVGPRVMLRADMDGLPIQEATGLSYASKATQVDPVTGNEVYVMHACGHDVHITSLIGTAKYMSEHRDAWSGTLMLIVQPAEERILGAKMMMQDDLWHRFGKPDHALAFHVNANLGEGLINVVDDSPYAGADTVDIIVHGIGAHGASPHQGKDPIVLASQIVLALQTLVSRELPPRTPGVITVGSFHAGSKHNIISNKAHLQLTVRNTSLETRKTLLDGIKRIATNLGRAAGLPEDKLPEVIISEESAPPTVNDPKLAQQLRRVWQQQFGEAQVKAIEPTGMGAEDFPYFTTDPKISSVYFNVGGTKTELYKASLAGKQVIAGHHSPYFKIEPKPSIITGTKASISALLSLMPNTK